MGEEEAVQRGFLEAGRSSDYWRSVCVDTMLRRVLCWDGGEPEDATLTRDFAPLVDELNRLASQRTIHALGAESITPAEGEQ